MNNDKEFLNWLADRLVHVYNENPNVDFVHKLKNIAKNIDKDQYTPNLYENKHMKPSVDIYLDEEYDRFDTNIEFYIDPNHTFSISIDPSGDIAWAYIWGEHKYYGSGKLFVRENKE